MIKTIRRKLRSRSGESMLLALMFMMFCSFIGSTVLVSATANAYRVKHLSEQQDQLTERSTALLLTDELQLNDGERLQLNVADSLQSIQNVYVYADGSSAPTAEPPRFQRIITFRVYTTDAYTNPAQRLMLESTVQRYLNEYPRHPEDTSAETVTQIVKLETFPAGGPSDGELVSTTEFWFQPVVPAGSNVIEGTIEVEGTSTPLTAAGTGTLPSYTLYFSSGREGELYDFFMAFDDSSPLTSDADEFSHLKVTMNAFYSANTSAGIQSPVAVDESSSTHFSKTTTTLTQTVISWDDPLIEKGGAAD